MIRITRYIPLCIVGLMMAACSTTSNLPEGETLYTGISKISYGEAVIHHQADTTQQEGVITALANAYNTVEGLLTGTAQASDVLKPEEMTSHQRDSVKAVQRVDREAYTTTRQEVEGVLSYTPNGSLMGSSYTRWPIHPRLAIYNRYVNSTSRFGRWLLNAFGATPRYISNASPSVRTQVARNTLHNYGFFRATTAFDTVQNLRKPRQARIAYQIQPGVLFHLDSIAYQMFPVGTDSLIRSSMNKTLLHRGEPFSVVNLDAERTRLSTLFRNNGYYYFGSDYITYRADTIAQPTLVQLQVRPSTSMPDVATRPFHIGNTRVRLFDNDNFQVADSLQLGDFGMKWSGQTGRPPLKPEVIQRFLFYRHGGLYRQRGQEFVLEKLQSLGIFSQVGINYVPRDTTTVGGDTLDVEINAMLSKPYDAEFQGAVTTKSNGQVGPGVTFSMSKLNAFRGAETLSFKAWGSYEWQTGADLHGDRSVLNSYEYGTSLDLLYPRLRFFRLGRELDRRAVSSTDFMVNARWMNRAGYFGRVSLGGRVTYTFQPHRNIKHEFTPFRLDYDVQMHTTARFDSIVAVNQALYASMRDQFVPSIEYTYSWSSRHHAVRTFTLNAKESGNITSGIYALCGQGWTRRDKELFGVPFAQYLKATAEYTHQFPLTENSCIATRIFGGAIWSYGNSTIAPYNDLFTIGGANSIRAFAARSIGPGSYQPANSRYSYLDQMGGLKFELNAEYRFPIVASLYGAVFMDTGNVWLVHDDPDRPGGQIDFGHLGDQLALGTGAGLRYDMDFLVIRFDVGVGIHAPYDTGHSGYYNMTSFGKSLGYHLAIGYPF